MDSSLWKQIKSGNAIAFKTVYQNSYQDLYAFGFRVTADKEKVKDCIHEMFCEIWQKRNTISDVENIRSYLKTYLKRKLLKDLVNDHQSLEISDFDQLPIGQQHSYEYLLIQSQTDSESKDKIYHALNQLTSSQKEIINLKYFEGFSYEQIADLLELSTRTIYNHVYEALCKLKKHLK
ncbi:sigma-70 family RNA polymerase sigma factor [Pedobacter sp. SD-b]|uniref:Sigma-70 family RNA polymerase sigma factor n=1 Tax=Pedobacter segetis TaxID=2793069 RepID=A0ABS1BN06_9SPHI|nr:sigma-70 family RNA polymerase sigma factor [Pedobacter segetis]MBK0384265.1 sigma-70 family RNA polymerase sigma factor [Pedobacter segetis]